MADINAILKLRHAKVQLAVVLGGGSRWSLYGISMDLVNRSCDGDPGAQSGEVIIAKTAASGSTGIAPRVNEERAIGKNSVVDGG